MCVSFAYSTNLRNKQLPLRCLPPGLARLKADSPREEDASSPVCRSVLWPVGGARVWDNIRKWCSEDGVFQEVTLRWPGGDTQSVGLLQEVAYKWGFCKMSYLEGRGLQFWLKFMKWRNDDKIISEHPSCNHICCYKKKLTEKGLCRQKERLKWCNHKPKNTCRF